MAYTAEFTQLKRPEAHIPASTEAQAAQIVSDDNERLILVNASDEVVGHLDKRTCHDNDGVLHRAFSLFIFNADGDLLIQQRAADKRLWPLYWSNSCCSHPREGESMDQAVQRRLAQELGFHTPLRFVYKFEYQAQYGDLGAEHELCSVYVGQFDAEVRINPTEIEAWRWMSRERLTRELAEQADRYTPWFHMEWQRLNTEFAESLPS